MAARFRFHSLLALTLAIIFGGQLHAQYQGLNLRGDVGVKSGSQPLPGFYFATPLFYQSSYTGIRDGHGNEILTAEKLKMNVFATPAVSIVTPFKILEPVINFAQQQRTRV